MTQRSIILLILNVVLSFPAWTQVTSLDGRVLDGKTKLPLSGATVRLINVNDTTMVLITTTSAEGTFIIPGTGLHAYDLDITFIGYISYTKFIRIDKPHLVLGDILMTPSVVPLSEVLVQGKAIPAIQKGDTTELNAKAFKVNPDADAGDLMAKMPGITITNGAVKAQGEDVQQVLVDGKPFFGNDPTVALRNLPADAIEKIQVYDKQSDQAEFTGFDDGQASKTINIVTKSDRRDRRFGKMFAGYGENDRYLAGGGINSFNGDTRASILGFSGNVNQQNFSSQDIMGVMSGSGRRGGGGEGGGRGEGGPGGPGGGPQGGSGGRNSLNISQQSGITTANSVGMSFSDIWWDKLNLNQSYFFNSTHGENEQKLNRQYFGSTDTSRLYRENSKSDTRNYNHRIDTRVEYSPDSSNSFIEQPRLYFQNYRSSSTLSGANTLTTSQPISQTGTDNESDNSGYNFSNHFLYRHKFDTPGRTISFDFEAGKNRKEGTTLQQSYSMYNRGAENMADTIDQQTPTLTNTYSFSSRAAYTEPIVGNSLIQIMYNPSYSKNEADNRKYRFNPLTQAYTDQVDSLSNLYENEYSTNSADLAYRFKTTGFNLMARVSYQIATLRGQQTFPYTSSLTKTFYNVLPNAMLSYNIAKHSGLRIFYRTSTSAPQISQLQDVIDNTNVLLLTTGNPDLKQSFSNSFFSRLSLTNPGDARSLFLFLSVVYTGDYIGNATLTAAHDTVVMRGIQLNRGAQLTYPVNLDGYWSARTSVAYSFPADILSSNLNMSTDFSYSRTPGLINDNLNIANAYVFGQGATLSSNISESVDFTLSYMGNYNLSKNSLESNENTEYFSHTIGAKVNLMFWEGIVLRNELNNAIYAGLSSGYNQNSVLWNIAIGKKFLAGQRGEIRLTITDLLNQNKSVNRSVTETYVEDTQNEVLGRYLLLTASYTLK
jgi:hypothetical protein